MSSPSSRNADALAKALMSVPRRGLAISGAVVFAIVLITAAMAGFTEESTQHNQHWGAVFWTIGTARVLAFALPVCSILFLCVILLSIVIQFFRFRFVEDR
jgi:hypothetical protein